jgi:cytochrome c553
MFTRCVSTIIAIGAVSTVLGGPLQAQDIEYKARACTACHGTDGKPPVPAQVPIIWGQQPYYIFKQLRNYRNGMREHPMMSAIAKALPEAELRPLANYFGAKPWPAQTATPAPPPNGIAMCAPCHQNDFKGGLSWPRLAGLSYEYLLGTMNAFAKEERTNNSDMVQIMKMFSEADRQAMARFLAGL